jgi:hypothetical protein
MEITIVTDRNFVERTEGNWLVDSLNGEAYKYLKLIMEDFLNIFPFHFLSRQ